MVERSLRIVVLAALVGLGMMALPSRADHVHMDNGRIVTFDHKTGNEWWVEVVLAGQDGGQVSGVEAQDTNGPWLPLEKKSWGAWASSFRIEAGHDVRFRASWPGGAQTVSCWFEHPSGIEQCGTPTSTTTSSSPPPTSTSSTTTSSNGPNFVFDHRTGNEWWVEAAVTGATPARVEAQREGGAWTPLQLKSWGAWAASFHVPPGSDVRFRAAVDNGWQESCWFTHPQGLTPNGGQTCTGTSGSGSTTTSTTATPTSTTTTTTSSSTSSTANGFTATFSNVKGNPWWVEARVAGNRPLQGVEARVDDGAWRPLTLREWGAWAASFHVPDGSYVDFRATSSDGATSTSGDYVWPTARPITAWPVSGSFVEYRLHKSGGAPDGSYNEDTRATLRLTYDGTAWTGRCTGSTTTTDHTGTQTTGSFDVAASGAPATAPRDLQAGQEFDPALLEDASYGDPCRQDIDRLVAETYARHQASLRDSPGGRQVTLQSWMSGEPSDATPYRADTLVHETRLGLALDWSFAGRGGGFDGHLVDTDAPIR